MPRFALTPARPPRYSTLQNKKAGQMYQQPTGISAKLRTMRMMFFMTGIGISVWAIVVPFTKIRFQLSDGTLGLMLLAGGTGGMLVMPFAGMAIGRWGSRAVLIAVGLTFG